MMAGLPSLAARLYEYQCNQHILFSDLGFFQILVFGISSCGVNKVQAVDLSTAIVCKTAPVQTIVLLGLHVIGIVVSLLS